MHHSSEPPQSDSPSPPQLTSSPSMIHVGRPLPPHHFSTLASHYTPRSRYINTSYPTSPSPPSPPATPPLMRASKERGVKRARSEEPEEDAEDRHGSESGSEDSGNVEQPIMPAPKKRTRTLMTPDQLTALHRLLSQTRFPTTEQREQCGREIGLSARRVQVWFQNQRQKSKAQQQANAAAGGSRPLAPQQGPYRVFSYNSSYYEPPSRPYTSPHPYAHPEPELSTELRRSQRLGHHRRGTSSQSYAPGPSGRYEYTSGYPQPYVAETELSHSPAYYDRFSPRRSPEPSGPTEDATLPPIWPDHEPERRPSLSPVVSTSAGLTRRPSLLPTGLPPPQPLEPTPLWDHPHTNPRYMRPLPASGLSSLISGLSRGRARSDPPLATSHPPRGLGLQLEGISPATKPDAREDAPTSSERTRSDPTLPVGHRPSSRFPEHEHEPEAESTRPRTSRGRTHSRHSSDSN